MFAKICQDSRLMGYGKKRIDGDKFLIFPARHGQAQEIHPMFRTLKSNSPFSAPRDDTARASCGNGAKRKLLSFTFRTPPPGERHIEDHAAGPSIFSTFSNPIRAVKQISDFSPTVADIQFPGRIPAAPAL